MSDREPRDFMSVDSFAQLPFIRPPPRSAIRLFGIEVPHQPAADVAAEEEEEEALDASKDENAGAGGESSAGRKFECHYCCRQFPTSQALGGHQNAHKRERQHARRVHHLAGLAHQGPAAVDHVYGLFNYHHQHHALGPPLQPPPSAYPSSWHASFYGGGVGAAAAPGVWRHHHHRTPVPLQLTRGDRDYSRSLEFVGGGAIDLAAAAAAPPPPPIPRSQFEFHLNIPSSAKENVSLDLHL